MVRFSKVGVYLCGAVCAGALSAYADTNADKEHMIVWGSSLDLIGTVDSASSGRVGYADFEFRPIFRPGELLEVVPGLIATQHSGSGKANQYFLRGFNLDHGTDFAAYFEGAPVNFRTHGHGQGYLDINFIIPEIVEYVDFRKGPYFAEIGDFSAAGSASFKTYDSLDEGFVEVTAGEFGFYRLVAANSIEAGDGDLLFASELQIYDGPWELDEDLQKFNALVKWTGSLGAVNTQLIGTAYYADWTSTDQVPLRAVESGLIDRFGFIDPDLGGETTRIGITARASVGGFEGTAYATYYDFNLFSNFTYFLNDPVNGDEFEQQDQRYVFGALGSYHRHVSVFNQEAEVRVGGEIRYDDINDVGLFQTVARRRIATVRDDSVSELSLSGYVDANVQWTDRLRTVAGVRVDYYDFDVDAQIRQNSGSGSDTIVSPKFTVAYQALENLELYANYGRGFHSNDVRGATIAIDPVTGDAVDPVDVLVRADGAEIGLRANPIEGLTTTFAAFYLELDSELLFVGDAGTTEPNDGTRRFGIEFAAFYEPLDWLVFDVSGGYTNARFKDDPPGGDRIPGAVESVLGAGATVVLANGFSGSLRLRHFGEAPLIEDNSVRSDSTTLVNLGVAYDIGPVQLSLDVFNILDAEDADITYFFESQLQGETSPREDIHFHPVEPRSVRGTVRFKF